MRWRMREGRRRPVIAPLKQTLRFEAAGRSQMLSVGGGADVAGDGSGLLAVASGLAGFFCLLPYPALSIGGTSAMQIGNLLTMLMVLPVLAMSWRGRAFWIYPVILLPLVLSAAK